MKDVLIPIDQAGRIVLPKSVRQELAVKPGDTFKVSIQGATVTLTPSNETTGLVRKGKALVFSTTGNDVLGSDAVEEQFQEARGERWNRLADGLSGAKRKQ